MNKRIGMVAVIGLGASLAALLAGCGTPPASMYEERVTNHPEVLGTVVSPETNEAGVVTLKTNTVVVAEAWRETNHVVRPEVEAALRVGAGLLGPWGEAVGGLGMLGLGIWGQLAQRRKNRLLQVAQVALGNVESARTVIRSIPGGEGAAADKRFIEGIVESQTYAGVRGDIDRLLGNR